MASRVAAFVEVGDEDEDRLDGAGDEALAVGQRAVDVGAAAELGAEEQVDRVVQVFGQVDDGGVEDDHPGVHGPDGGEDGAEDAGVDDGGGHRAALVHAEDDVAQRWRSLAAVADEPLGDDRAVVGLVVLQVGADGAVPVDLGGAGPTGAGGAVEGCRARPAPSSARAGVRVPRRPCLTTRRAVSFVLLGDDAAQARGGCATRCTSGSTASSISGSRSICWRPSRSRASFCMTRTTGEGKYVRMSPSQRVTFGADAPEPDALAVLFAAVEGGQHAVHAPVLPGEAGADSLLRVAAEDEPPAAQAFLLIRRAPPPLSRASTGSVMTPGDGPGLLLHCLPDGPASRPLLSFLTFSPIARRSGA